MIEIDKKDIAVLDFIINECLFKSSVELDDLLKNNLIVDNNSVNFNSRISYNPTKEFNRLANIVKEYKVCDIIETSDGKIITTNESTNSFQKSGGFKKIFDENRFKSKKEELEFKKSKIDLELSKKMLKEYPYTKWFSRIGFVIAIVLAVLEIIQWKNK